VFTGVVLAGGLGRRMGAPKATALLAGHPLIEYPSAALRLVCERVVVVAKRRTDLPPELERWDEPDEPQHPVAGLCHALQQANGPILVCAADMPFVTAEVLRLIAAELHPSGNAAVGSCDGRIEPLLAAYAPEALGALRRATPDEPLRRTVEALEPALVEVAPELVFNVNTPEELAEAERRLTSG